MFRAHVPIIRRSKLYYTASGIITPIRGRLMHRLREDSISVINQLDAQNFCFTISLFHASTCFEHYVPIITRSKLYYTASGIITPIGGRLMHRLREDSILLINQLDEQNFCFYNKLISCLYMFRALCVHHQEVKIVLHSLWYHHTKTSEGV